MDKDIIYKVGFNVYTSPLSEPVARWTSKEMVMRFNSPKSWIEYPLELTNVSFSQEGEEGTDSAGYSIEGRYSVTIETLIKSVMWWEVILNVPGDFID